DFGWMSRKSYEQRLDEVSLGLQVSLADSFNQVVAEHLFRGIPVIASAMIPVLKNIDAESRARLIVNNPEDALEITDRIKYLLGNPEARDKLGNKVRQLFLAENTERIKQATSVLTEVA
ncbi:MAG TPA: glycosyltransferase, partial [Blastocatellia bacterium]|nr:glycosyltransferase [Blastocatellia bacterium]